MTVGPLTVTDLVVEFIHDGYAIRPLDGLSFEAQAGELVVLLGPSGCGKTTLLSCLGGILTPTSGSIRLGDTDVTAMKGKQLDVYRREQIGFVFQAFNLIPSLTARENIAVPLHLTGHGRKESFDRADELLEQVGLGDRGHHLPSKLSGGQQQRVAVARGLGHNPPLLLADEPTANLDHIQAEAIIRVLQSLRDDGRMIVVSTHDSRLVPIADRIVQLIPVGGHDEVATHEVTFGAGESIFEQGDHAELIYVVKSGEVDVIRVLADGGEELLTQLGPDQYFGELGPFLGFPRRPRCAPTPTWSSLRTARASSARRSSTRPDSPRLHRRRHWGRHCGRVAAPWRVARQSGTARHAGRALSARMMPMSAKSRRLVPSELIDLPVVEASGVAVRRTDRGPMLLVIGDRTADLGACRIGDDGALGEWTTLDLAALPGWPLPLGDSQFESIAADGGSLVALMREDPPVVLVADTTTRELRAEITLTAPTGSLLDGRWDDVSSRWGRPGPAPGWPDAGCTGEATAGVDRVRTTRDRSAGTVEGRLPRRGRVVGSTDRPRRLRAAVDVELEGRGQAAAR